MHFENAHATTSCYYSMHIAVQEVQHVCKCAVQRNTYQMSVNARRQSFEAWRQLVEILLTGCPTDLLTGELRQNVIFELLQDLLDKACTVSCWWSWGFILRHVWLEINVAFDFWYIILVLHRIWSYDPWWCRNVYFLLFLFLFALGKYNPEGV